MNNAKDKHLQTLLIVGYIAAIGLFLLVYGLAAFLPEQHAIWQGMLQNVSISLAVAMMISFGSYVLLRPLLMDRERQSLEAFQKAALELLATEKGVREAGVVRVYENLDMAILSDHLKRAQKRVCFLSIWLSSQPEKLGVPLSELAAKGVRVQILQANPRSDICTLRAHSQKALFPEESTFEPAFIGRIIEDNNAYYQKLKAEQDVTVEVRLFDLLPPFSLILIDNSAFIRFYGYGEKAVNTPHIEFRFNDTNNEFNFFGEFIQSQFNLLWNNAQTAT